MRSLILILSLGLLFSCTEFEGVLTVNSETTLESKDDTLLLTEGSQQAKFKFKSRRRMEIKVGDQELKVKFNKKLKVPSNGEFTLTKSETSLNYDLAGSVSTTVERGPIRHITEGCTYSRPVQVCDNRGRCRVIYRNYHGRRHLEYRDDLIVKDIKLNIVEEAQFLAEFDGGTRYYQRVNLYEGQCY